MISDNKPRKLDAGSFTLLSNLAEIVVRSLLKDAEFDPQDLPLSPEDQTPSPQINADAEATVEQGTK